MTVLKGIRFNNPEDGFAIAAAAGTSFNPVVDIVIARIDDDGEVIGGAAYNSWTGRGGSINVHYAGFRKRWINRLILWVCFDYPFNQLGCKKMFGQVPAKNAVAIKNNLHIGWRAEKLIKDVFPDDDMLLMSMYREDCRFLGNPPKAVMEAPHGR